MAYVIGVTGLSGVGKTTAIVHFENLGLGQRVYLGEEVLKELNSRGLARNSANEQSIRLNLRQIEGPAVLAMRAAPLIKRILARGTNVFLDAIFAIEEYQYLQTSFPGSRLMLLAIIASREVRLLRLASRPERPLTSEEMGVRDANELSRLKTGNVIDHANYIIENESTLIVFQRALEQFWSNVTT
jgi:dephospho-CoA kinase